jgi:hypothetical protein
MECASDWGCEEARNLLSRSLASAGKTDLLTANTREVYRVLRPNGTFALVAETYRGGPFRLLYSIVMPLLRAAFLTEDEHHELFMQAGFTEVESKHVLGKNWILVAGRRLV